MHAAVLLTLCCLVDRLHGIEPSAREKRTSVESCGAATAASAWPWLAALFWKTRLAPGKSRTEFRCAATLVSRGHLLTAAHCVARPSGIPLPEDLVLIRLGANHIDDETEEGIVHRRVATIRVAEGFGRRPDDSGFDNDLAVLRLSKRFDYSDFIRPICLDDASDSGSQEAWLYAVGWAKSAGGSIHTAPSALPSPALPAERCVARGLGVTTPLLCAGVERRRDAENGGDSCIGDAASGLYEWNGRLWIVRGVATASLGAARCGDADLAAFVDVKRHLEWIRGVVTMGDDGA